MNMVMLIESPATIEASYRLMRDLLATTPRRDRNLCARLLIAMAGDAVGLGDRERAMQHISDAIDALYPKDRLPPGGKLRCQCECGCG